MEPKVVHVTPIINKNLAAIEFHYSKVHVLLCVYGQFRITASM